jgi:hypothetical protein
VYMSPGSRAWDETHSRSSPRASAELYTLRQRRKEKFRKRGDQPRNVAAENTQEDTEARRGRRINRKLRAPQHRPSPPSSFSNHALFFCHCELLRMAPASKGPCFPSGGSRRGAARLGGTRCMPARRNRPGLTWPTGHRDSASRRRRRRQTCRAKTDRRDESAGHCGPCRRSAGIPHQHLAGRSRRSHGHCSGGRAVNDAVLRQSRCLSRSAIPNRNRRTVPCAGGNGGERSVAGGSERGERAR